MNNEDFDLENYENKSYFELLEIATKEQDIKKRKTLFEYANKVLKDDFADVVEGGMT